MVSLKKYNSIMHKHQGFTKDMSCKTQLIEAIYDWTNILNKEKGQIDIIHDISKDFYIGPHHHLVMKLYMYGIMGKDIEMD